MPSCLQLLSKLLSTSILCFIFLQLCIFQIFAFDPSDFLLDTDESSVIAYGNHICVIEYKTGFDIGGQIHCLNQETSDEPPPKDVSHTFSCQSPNNKFIFCRKYLSN